MTCWVMFVMASVMLMSFLADVTIQSTNPCSLQKWFYIAIRERERNELMWAIERREKAKYHHVFVERDVHEVALVGHEHDWNRIAVGQRDLLIDVLLPLHHCFEGGRSREVEHDHSRHGVLIIDAREIAITFCARFRSGIRSAFTATSHQDRSDVP